MSSMDGVPSFFAILRERSSCALVAGVNIASPSGDRSLLVSLGPSRRTAQ